jgi:hypothetical protein
VPLTCRFNHKSRGDVHILDIDRERRQLLTAHTRRDRSYLSPFTDVNQQVAAHWSQTKPPQVEPSEDAGC